VIGIRHVVDGLPLLVRREEDASEIGVAVAVHLVNRTVAVFVAPLMIALFIRPWVDVGVGVIAVAPGGAEVVIVAVEHI
jgi:hypothetical protein